jgi:hypothetical protein
LAGVCNVQTVAMGGVVAEPIKGARGLDVEVRARPLRVGIWCKIKRRSQGSKNWCVRRRGARDKLGAALPRMTYVAEMSPDRLVVGEESVKVSEVSRGSGPESVERTRSQTSSILEILQDIDSDPLMSGGFGAPLPPVECGTIQHLAQPLTGPAHAKVDAAMVVRHTRCDNQRVLCSTPHHQTAPSPFQFVLCSLFHYYARCRA